MSTISSLSAGESVFYNTKHSANYDKTISKLASGERFVTPGDDPSIQASIGILSSDIKANQALSENMNDNKGLLASANTYISEQLSDMQNVKEKLIEISKDGLSKEQTAGIGTTLRALLDKIDTISSTAKYNNVSMLNGELKNATVQLGINSFERLAINLPSTRTTNLGTVRFETGAQIIKPDKVDLLFKINKDEDFKLDTVTIGHTQGTGIGKLVEYINSASDKIGQRAAYNVTTTGSITVNGGTLTALEINDIDIGDIEIVNGDTNNNLIDTINKKKSQTGVIASRDENDRLVLHSPDGRGIIISASSGLGLIGIDDKSIANYGKLTLIGENTERTTLQNPDKVGFDRVDSFVFSARDLANTKLSSEKLSALGAQPNQNVNARDTNDILNNKDVVKSFTTIIDDAIFNLQTMKKNIGSTINKLRESQDRVFDLNIIYKGSLDDKQNVNYAEEIYNKEKFSNLISSSTYALSNSLSKQKDIIEDLLKSVSEK